MPGTPIRITSAARILELSRTHALKLMEDGKMDQVKTGDGTVMVTLESVEKLKKEREAAQEE